MKIGAQLYTVHNCMTDSESIKSGLKRIREIGYEYVQLSGIARMDVGELKSTLDELGIKAICTHVPFEAMKNNIKEVTAAHKQLGCGYVGLGAMPSEYRCKDGFVTFAKEFDEIAEKYEAEGLKITYHNHDFEFVDYDGKTGMQLLLENSKRFLFLIDTFWIQAGGGDVIQWINDLKDRIEIVHFKDYGLVKNDECGIQRVMREIGYGNLNWKGIIDTCEKIGVTHAFVEQDNCNGNDPYDSLKLSYDFLKTVVK